MVFNLLFLLDLGKETNHVVVFCMFLMCSMYVVSVRWYEAETCLTHSMFAFSLRFLDKTDKKNKKHGTWICLGTLEKWKNIQSIPKLPSEKVETDP